VWIEVGLHEFEVREQATAYSSAVINIVQSGELRGSGSTLLSPYFDL